MEFGNSLKFDKHISSMIGSSFFHLCLLAKIKQVLSEILTCRLSFYLADFANFEGKASVVCVPNEEKTTHTRIRYTHYQHHRRGTNI